MRPYLDGFAILKDSLHCPVHVWLLCDAGVVAAHRASLLMRPGRGRVSV